MRVRNTLTGQEGYVKVYTWWQGLEFPVFINGELEFWKQEHIEILHDRPIVRTVRRVKKEYYDPFAGYTDNELQDMLDQMTFRNMVIGGIKRVISYFQDTINLVKNYQLSHHALGASA